ncbi:MAG: hypothetical protein CMO81_01920 [Waddliaceae bacterium]|nr:hypothetical protein [Waddliaceae bacterium]
MSIEENAIEIQREKFIFQPKEIKTLFTERFCIIIAAVAIIFFISTYIELALFDGFYLGKDYIFKYLINFLIFGFYYSYILFCVFPFFVVFFVIRNKEKSIKFLDVFYVYYNYLSKVGLLVSLAISYHIIEFLDLPESFIDGVISICVSAILFSLIFLSFPHWMLCKTLFYALKKLVEKLI